MIITDSEHKAFCDLMRRSNYYLGELARLFFSGEGKEHRARIILTPFIGREINVASVNVEMSLENIGRRGIRMDVVAIDEDGSMFDVELQRDPAARTRTAHVSTHLLSTFTIRSKASTRMI